MDFELVVMMVRKKDLRLVCWDSAGTCGWLC